MTKRPVPGGYTLESLPTPNIGCAPPSAEGGDHGSAVRRECAGSLCLQVSFTYKRNVKAAGGRRASLVAQGLGLRAFNAGSTGLIPGQGIGQKKCIKKDPPRDPEAMIGDHMQEGETARAEGQQIFTKHVPCRRHLSVVAKGTERST